MLCCSYSDRVRVSLHSVFEQGVYPSLLVIFLLAKSYPNLATKLFVG